MMLTIVMVVKVVWLDCIIDFVVCERIIKEFPTLESLYVIEVVPWLVWLSHFQGSVSISCS